MEEEAEKRKQALKKKIMSLFSDKRNAYAVLILIFALVLRLYIFSLTNGQPLWWDEADYMVRAKAFFYNTPLSGWNPAREILAPFLWGFLMFVGGGSEILPRFLQVLISTGIVWLVYAFGKEAFNSRVGLIAAFIAAVNGMFLFYTGRLLTYLWAPFFFLLTFYFFWKAYYKDHGMKYVILAPLSAAVGTAAYGSVAFGIAALGGFLILTEGYKFLLKKKLWLMAVIGILAIIPHLLWTYFTTGDPFSRWHTLEKTMINSDWSYFFGYFKLFPHLFGKIICVLIAISFIFVLFEVIVSFDLIIKSKEKGKNPKILLILWIFIVMGFYIYNAIKTLTVWETFIFSAFPAFFLITGVFLDMMYKINLKKQYVTYIIIIILLIAGYGQINYSVSLTKSKVNSFNQIRDAGLWIKLNTPEDSTIYTTSTPQMTYYSERKNIRIPDSPEEMSAVKIKENSYYAASVFERANHIKWIFAYPVESNLSPIAAFFFDPETKKNVAAVIYKLE